MPHGSVSHVAPAITVPPRAVHASAVRASHSVSLPSSSVWLTQHTTASTGGVVTHGSGRQVVTVPATTPFAAVQASAVISWQLLVPSVAGTQQAMAFGSAAAGMVRTPSGGLLRVDVRDAACPALACFQLTSTAT